MELANPEVIRSVGELPIITVCLLVIFGQFLMTLKLARETLRELRTVSTALAKVLIRFEDWLRQNGG